MADRGQGAPDDPAAPADPFVSVVMPVRNEARYLGDALAAVLACTYPVDRMEVLVVDGGSTDGTIALVRAASERDGRVRLIPNPAGSTPAGLNEALRRAAGDLIVRVDGHTLIEPGYVTACVRALSRTGAWMVGGPMTGRGDTPVGRAVAAATATPLGAGDAAFRLGGEGPVDTVYLGAWHRWVFDRVGGFDEGLARNQDYELTIRIREAGGTVWLDPAIRSNTIVRGTFGDLARQYYGYGTGRAATLRRHPRSLRLRQAVPAAFVLTLGLGALLSLVQPSLRRLTAAIGLVYGVVLVLASLGTGRRLPGSAMRRLPAVYAITHLSWGAGFWVGAVRCAVHASEGRLRTRNGRPAPAATPLVGVSSSRAPDPNRPPDGPKRWPSAR